jgi:hypothetical protein
MFDPREFGLDQPCYFVTDEPVRKAVGGITRVYAENRAGRLRLTKRGRNTVILAPDLVAYLKMLQHTTDGLRPSPNAKATSNKQPAHQ